MSESEYNPKGFNVPEGLEKAESLFGSDFHQVAIYTSDVALSATTLGWIGFDTWALDTARLEGFYSGRECSISAKMAFNYQILDGREFEFVSYSGHPDLLYRNPPHPFISHLSSYVDNISMSIGFIYEKHGLRPYHVFETSNHTNPRVAGKKHFREAIFDTRQKLGFNLKIIEKVLEG